MFIYLVTLTNGKSVRVVTEGDPTIHPSFFGRVANVETLGQSDKLLSLV
jgi:precorrin-2 methylase